MEDQVKSHRELGLPHLGRAIYEVHAERICEHVKRSEHGITGVWAGSAAKEGRESPEWSKCQGSFKRLEAAKTPVATVKRGALARSLSHRAGRARGAISLGDFCCTTVVLPLGCFRYRSYTFRYQAFSCKLLTRFRPLQVTPPCPRSRIPQSYRAISTRFHRHSSALSRLPSARQFPCTMQVSHAEKRC